MDTDDLSNMAYACIVAANEVTDILKTELGVASGQYETEEEYLKGILKHVQCIEVNAKDYLDDWNLIEKIDIKIFKKKLRQLKSQIQATIDTPIENRGNNI